MEKLIAWALTALTTIASAFIGSFLGGYLRKKGENRATHEDLNKLVEQMKAVTEATKTIESNISNETWDRQRHWELKRDAVYGVMQALGKADDTLHFVAAAIVPEGEVEDQNSYREVAGEAWEKFHLAIDEFDRKRALALIVCGKMMNDAMMAVMKELRRLALLLAKGELASYEAHKPDLASLIAVAYASARHELGIEGKDELKSITGF